MKVEPIRDKELIRECMEYLKWKDEKYYIMFSIGIFTALRISDILQLKVRDVYCKNRISVKQKKTGQYIYIPINNELKKILKEYCNDKPGHWYLVQSRVGHNKPVTTTMCYKILREMAEYLNIDRVGCHTMRKTGAYHMYKQSKNNIATVMKILGHKDPAITLMYIGVNEEDVDNTIRKLKYW